MPQADAQVADEQLMLAYRDGDADAFATLYARHKGGLFRFVLRSVRDRSAAEELFQEVWMKIIDARARYVPQAKFSTYLYTIAHNRMIDHWRRQGLAAVSLDDEEAFEPSGPDSMQPERRAELNQSGQRLIAALGALPLLQREAFLLHEESGMSVPEIAAATGTEPETAKSRLRYAVAKLREALANA
jgi:RNA polymerase sigma-70 factor (ECF subfamily)